MKQRALSFKIKAVPYTETNKFQKDPLFTYLSYTHHSFTTI